MLNNHGIILINWLFRLVATYLDDVNVYDMKKSLSHKVYEYVGFSFIFFLKIKLLTYVKKKKLEVVGVEKVDGPKESLKYEEHREN